MFKYDSETTHWVLDFKVFRIKFKNIFHKKLHKSKYNIQGIDNKILLIDKFNNKYKLNKKINGLNINVIGNNNNIEIADNCFFERCQIIINANNCNIKLGNGCVLRNLNIMALFGDYQILEIKEKVNCIGANIHLKDEHAKVFIGANTLLSYDINIWATDGHALIDNTSKEILNIPRDGITIGDNCWIGFGATITKNSCIQNNSVVGACSVLTKKFNESNVLLAGNPAKIVKRNISWDVRPPHTYKKEMEKT